MADQETVKYLDTGHAGRDIVDYAHRLLLIDEEWTERHDTGFAWWAHTLRQRFTWRGPIEIDELPTWFIHVETDFLRGIDGDDPDLRSFVNEVNRNLGIGAAIIEHDRVSVHSRLYAMPETTVERGKHIADVAIMTNAFLHAWLDGNNSFDQVWPAAVTQHPDQGQRALPDDMLNIVARFHLPRGSEPADDSFQAQLDQSTVSAMRLGMSAFGGDFEGVIHARLPSQTLPVLITQQRAYRHSLFGYGFMTTLSIPAGKAESMAGRPALTIANELNQLETVVDRPLLACGGWSVETVAEEDRLIHQQFVPNVSLLSGMAPVYFGDAIWRVRRVKDHLEANAG